MQKKFKKQSGYAALPSYLISAVVLHDYGSKKLYFNFSATAALDFYLLYAITCFLHFGHQSSPLNKGTFTRKYLKLTVFLKALLLLQCLLFHPKLSLHPLLCSLFAPSQALYHLLKISPLVLLTPFQ